jgi:hypothetical protein
VSRRRLPLMGYLLRNRPHRDRDCSSVMESACAIQEEGSIGAESSSSHGHGQGDQRTVVGGLEAVALAVSCGATYACERM